MTAMKDVLNSVKGVDKNKLIRASFSGLNYIMNLELGNFR